MAVGNEFHLFFWATPFDKGFHHLIHLSSLDRSAGDLQHRLKVLGMKMQEKEEFEVMNSYVTIDAFTKIIFLKASYFTDLPLYILIIWFDFVKFLFLVLIYLFKTSFLLSNPNGLKKNCKLIWKLTINCLDKIVC